MADMPHDGATFESIRVSEGGRRFFANRLEQLGRDELRGIFERARFTAHDGYSVDEWVEAFEERVREITRGPACPES